MARIFYGIMGDHKGHVSRALSVLPLLRGHEVLVAGGGHVLELREHGYPVHALPMPSTVLRHGRVDALATALNACRVLSGTSQTVRALTREMERFAPDLVISDYELFTPLAARRLGISSVSLDHQHVMTMTGADTVPGQAVSRLLTGSIIRALYSRTDSYWVTSFYHPRPRHDKDVRLLPPLLRDDVRELPPQDGSSVLAYIHSQQGDSLLRSLAATGREVHVYGLKGQAAAGGGIGRAGVHVHPPSRQGFLEHLARCAYVVTGGGHSLLSEALHLGKPVLCVPPSMLYEQQLNALYVHRMGYGMRVTQPQLLEDVLERFERRLPSMRKRLPKGRLDGRKALSMLFEEALG